MASVFRLTLPQCLSLVPQGRVHAEEGKTPEQVNLLRVSPLDGRYARQSACCAGYFSECAYIKYRVRVEVEYFLALTKVLPPLQRMRLSEDKIREVRRIYENFDVNDATTVKAKERITNHDVKAIEYFVKEKLAELGLGDQQEFVHFGLTSEDVNCTAQPLMLKEFIQQVYVRQLESDVLQPLKGLAKRTMGVPMLARTHGQPATPTMLGKEIMVFVERLENQLAQLQSVPFSGKFGGATGGLNAHSVAYRDVDWIGFANGFYKERFGLERQQYTTQIEHYDDAAAIFDACRRINTILLDFSKDMWQ